MALVLDAGGKIEAYDLNDSAPKTVHCPGDFKTVAWILARRADVYQSVLPMKAVLPRLVESSFPETEVCT